MDPLTVAVVIIELFSAVAGIIIGAWLVLPRIGSRKEAFVAAGVGGGLLIGLFLTMPIVGPATQVVIIALGTMVFACAIGMIHEAIFGFR